MTELIEALNSINDVIGFIENNTVEIFHVNVGGVDYTLDNTSLDVLAAVTCPSGSAGADGLCGKIIAKTFCTLLKWHK